MRRIGLSYARISGPQDERTASLESQEEAIVAKLESLGYIVPPEFRFRERWSGVESVYEREVLMTCRDLVASGRVQAFGCYDTDRLARDPRQLDAVVADCVLRGAEMVFARLDVDPTTRIGQLILQVKGFASITEIDALKDRTARGRLKKYQAGVHAGYGRVRYGYVRDPRTGARSIDPVTSAIVIRIFEAIASGVGPSIVCRMLNDEGIPTPFGKAKWTASTIRLMVREPTYYGHCVGRRTMSTGIKRTEGKTKGMVRQVPRPPDQHVLLEHAGFPAIISRDLWDRANAALLLVAAGPRPRAGKSAGDFLLAGMIRCGCGFRMTQEYRRHRSGKSRCYRCTGGAASRANTGNGCRISRGATWIEAEVWRRVVAFVMSDDAIERECRRLVDDDREKAMRRDLVTAAMRRKAVDREAITLLNLRLNHGDSRAMQSAFDAKGRELDAEAERLDATIADLRQRLIPYADAAATAEEFARRIRRFRKDIESHNTTSHRRDILIGLGIIVVVVGRREITIDVDARYACGENGSIPYNTPQLPTSRCLDVSL